MRKFKATKQTTTSSRRGATAVEFAICAPLVFAIFFAQLEFSRANLMRHSIETAAYEGARRGIVPGATANDIRTEALTILNAVSCRNPNISVSPAVILPTTTEVTVTISISLNENSWGAAKF